MKAVICALGLSAAVLASGCATTSNGISLGARGDSAGILGDQPTGELAQVIETGSILRATYLSAADQRRVNRQALNWGLWLASTATTAFTGLKVGGDTQFLSALSVTSIRALDPVLNPGDDGAWGVAFVQTTCVVAQLDAADAEEIRTVLRRLQLASQTDESWTALRDYTDIPRRGHSVLMQIYADYLTSTTPKLLDAGLFAGVPAKKDSPAVEGAPEAVDGEPQSLMEQIRGFTADGPRQVGIMGAREAPAQQDIDQLKRMTTATLSAIDACRPAQQRPVATPAP